MKKIFFYILSLLLVSLVIYSCSKDDDSDAPLDKSANLLTTGASANDILSNSEFSKLKIQIAHAPGFAPSQTSMTNFTKFLKEFTFKEDISLEFLEIPSENKDNFTLEEISALEQKHRTAYNSGSSLAIYIYFADAPSDSDDEDEGKVTLGAVFRNTSMVIYESTIRSLNAKSNAISLTDIETATLNHEFGHLLGLVDLGSPEINDHEDEDAENHCNVAGCLMRAELQFAGPMAKMLSSRVSKGSIVVPSLDAECRNDLKGNGGR